MSAELEEATERDDRGPVRSRARVDPAWKLLLGSVAAGMIVSLLVLMAVVLRRFIPPLGLGVALFGLALALMPLRPRASAIGVGVLALLWLALDLLSLPRSLPALAHPGSAALFVTTLSMLVLPAAGAVGLFGLLRGVPGRFAIRTLQGGGFVLVLAVVVGVIAGATGLGATRPAGSDDAAVRPDGQASVVLRGKAFLPPSLTVAAGTTVVWEWQDGGVLHNVVGGDFASDILSSGTFSHRFDEPGTYEYSCTLHPGMNGRVQAISRS